MIKAVWMWLGRLGYYLARPLFRLFPGLVSSPRVRVALRSPDDQLLLVRTWFGRQNWSFPGGGIARQESPEQAAVREVYEETGIRLAIEDLELIDTISSDEGIKGEFIVFEAEVNSLTLPGLGFFRRFEITDRVWWRPDDSMPQLSATARWYTTARRHSI